MKQFSVLTISSTVLVALSIVLTTIIVKDLNQYKIEKEEIASVLNFENRILTSAEWNPFSDASEEMAETFKTLRAESDQTYENGVIYSLYLFLAVLIYLGLNVFLYFKSKVKFRAIGMALIISSLCFIYLGLQTPFLEIEAFNTDLKLTLYFDDIPLISYLNLDPYDKVFDGKTYYFYQNKSVFQIIKLLFTGGNVVVGLCLVFFSVVFPLFKLFSSLFVLMYPKSDRAPLFEKIIAWIGKWSMADVFVAGIFLAFFSFTNMNVGVETDATTLIGLYYFVCFVILSISSSYFLKKSIEFRDDLAISIDNL